MDFKEWLINAYPEMKIPSNKEMNKELESYKTIEKVKANGKILPGIKKCGIKKCNIKNEIYEDFIINNIKKENNISKSVIQWTEVKKRFIEWYKNKSNERLDIKMFKNYIEKNYFETREKIIKNGQNKSVRGWSGYKLI